MAKFSVTNWRYGYLRELNQQSEAIDIHHVVVRKSNSKALFVCLSAIIISANVLHLLLVKDKSISIVLLSFILSAIFLKLMFWKRVEKESVIVMPSFGVQLETQYISGRIARRFVPVGKILKPVLLERVTPITCYWSLSLLMRGEAKLMLVFKELHPPLTMLIPVWKALCEGCKESSDTCTVDGQPCRGLSAKEM